MRRPTTPKPAAPQVAAAPALNSLRVPEPVIPSWRERLRLRWSAALLKRLLGHLQGNVAMRADLADVLWLLGRYREAIDQYDHVLRLDPRHTHALLRAGVAHMHLQQPEAALSRFNQAVKLAPDAIESHFRKATALGALKRRAEAIQALQRALSLAPHDARVHNQMGIVLLEGGDPVAAMVSFDRALAIEPGMAKALSNAAMVMLHKLRHAEAADFARKALLADPRLAAAHANLGLAQMWMGQSEAAWDSFLRAQAIQPDPRVTWSQAYLHLLEGRWQSAWPLFESRWDSVLQGKMPRGDRPLWDGQAPIAGRTVLVHPEQGLGDVIQFSRYVPVLADLGAHVILHAPRELLRLLSCLEGPRVKVVAQDQPVPPHDLRVHIMSLPGILGTSPKPKHVPGAAGYLSVPPERQQQWAHRMGPRQGPRVGLVWAGSVRPEQPDWAWVNARRNLPVSALRQLHQDGVTWYSLQKGKEAVAEWHSLQQRGWDGPAMVDLMDEVQDFADTAALITQLDLVIAVDTSTAHLAGALGKPVWLINRHDTCWRWMRTGATSPWYDSMRLFRPASADAPREQLVAEVAQALGAWVAAPREATAVPTGQAIAA